MSHSDLTSLFQYSFDSSNYYIVQYYAIFSTTLFRRCIDCETATCSACEVGELCQIVSLSCQRCGVNCVRVSGTQTTTVVALTTTVVSTTSSGSLGTVTNDASPSIAKPHSNNELDKRRIAGLVVAVVLVLLLGYVGFVLWSRHKRKNKENQSINSQSSEIYIPTGGRHELDISQNAEIFEISSSEEQRHELDGRSLPVEIGQS